MLQADAGDAAAGDLVGGGPVLFVGEVADSEAEATACPSKLVSFGGLSEPVDGVLAWSSLAELKVPTI